MPSTNDIKPKKKELIDSSGITEKGNDYSELLGPKVLEAMKKVTFAVTKFSSLFKASDIEPIVSFYVAYTKVNLEQPDLLLLYVKLTTSKVSPLDLIAMYREKPVGTKFFGDAIDFAVHEGAITKEQKSDVYNKHMSVLKLPKHSIKDSVKDIEETNDTYVTVTNSSIFLAFFYYYFYSVFERTDPDLLQEPTLNNFGSTVLAQYPMSLSDKVLFPFNLKNETAVSKKASVSSVRRIIFKGRGIYKYESVVKQKPKKESKKKPKKSKREGVKAGQKRLYEIFEHIKETFGDAFFNEVKDKFSAEYKEALKYIETIERKKDFTDQPYLDEKKLDEGIQYLRNVERDRRKREEKE